MFNKRRSADDFSAEIEAHLTLETDRLIAAGMRPDEARLAARNFGNVTAARERHYESHRMV